MAKDLSDALEQLRKTYASARPGARLAAIRQRLARSENEPASARLVALVAAVEALARSLVVHAPNRPPATAAIRYEQVRLAKPAELVAEALRMYASTTPAECFGPDTWQLFDLATQFRNLVVHECAHLEQDKQPHLLAAMERVFNKLVEAGGLLRVVQ